MKLRVFGVLIAACCCLSGLFPPNVFAESKDELQLSEKPAGRPDNWAQPIAGKPALPNFFKVSDQLYRGAQPADEGFAQLKKMGIKTVVNLRTFHSDRSECKEAGLDYVKISVQAWEAEESEIVEFLKIAIDPKRQPVFVHCQHGADRTGMMVAMYRMVVEGWSREEAIKEMTKGGFGFHAIWKNIIKFVQGVDPAAIRKQLNS